ncbi:MAG: IS3 family transposase [Gracilimonas sp.]|uniref:IS3 family transposase n=1 Tax=Gracilimonas sp. TaxID=1974203 RepID=UPI0037516A5C|nr:IS3 family transposase [Gracilimonas sp.]
MTDYSLNALYEVIGITKQGVWDHFRREAAELEMIREVIAQVDARRAEHRGEGREKLYWQIKPDRMGRDKFCDMFMQLGYGVRRPANRMRTTIAAHKVFDNLIEGRLVSVPHQVWQSDITYIKVGGRFYYLTFIIDVYTRRIVGYAVSDNLRAEANIKALQRALASVGCEQLAGCVHHSDRGSQYTDGRYLKMLRAHHMPISMGERAQDNAFAERVNGVIKNEYLIPRSLKTFRQLSYYSKQAVADYNTKRHYGSLRRCSPAEYEASWRELPTHKQKVEVIRSENTPNFLQASLQSNAFDTSCKYPYCTLHIN